MTLSRMAKGVSFSLAACLIAAGSARAGAPAAAPPDGTYSFSVTRAGSAVGTSTVTVKRVASSITVHEVETFGSVTETVDESLDQSRLASTAYASTFPVSSDVAATARVAMYNGGARVTLDTVPGSTDFNDESGTSNLVVVDGAMATGFLFLPAQVKAQGLSTFTILAPSQMNTLYCKLNAAAVPPRPSIPAADVEMTVDCNANGNGTEFIVWYDPQSFVVDEVDVPTQQVTIARARK
jgi:hypothetical protein